MDTNLVKSKSFSIRSIMSSPNLSKVIFEAIDAPAGSTKKTKAKSILKSFQQSHQNYLLNKMMRNSQDGQGGPGAVGLDVTGNSPLAKYAPRGIISSEGTFTPSTPITPAITARPAPVTTSLTLPSSSTPPRTLTTSSPTIGPTGSLLSRNLPPPPLTLKDILPATPSVPTTTLTFYRDPKLGSKDIYNAATGAKITATDWTKNWSGKAKEVPAPTKVGQPVASAIPTQDQSISGWDKETADLIYNKYINAGYTDAQAREELKKRTSFTPTAPTINPAKLTEDNAYDVLNNLANSSGNSELKTWYQSLSPEDQKRLQIPYESVMSGEGPASYAQRILSTKTLLGTILNLPKEVIDKFPDSGLLSDQINDLQDQVDKDFQIKERKKNMVDLLNQGLNIKLDLQSYIRQKDTYLGKLDKMINDFDIKTSRMDTSDPNVAQRMNNYRNYLTILAGRQNQRYIDFLDSAIQYQNNQYTQAENLYKLSLEEAEKRFTKEERSITESYNTIKDMLKDQYTNIENRTKMARDNESYQLEQLKAYYQLQKLIEDYNQQKTGTYAVIKDQLLATKGDDGFVNSDKYKELRSKSDDKTGFDKSFSFLLNPQDPTIQEFIKQESTSAAWMVDAAIWQWLSMDETKKLSDEEKAQYIKEAGRDPGSFGFYGY